MIQGQKAVIKKAKQATPARPVRNEAQIAPVATPNMGELIERGRQDMVQKAQATVFNLLTKPPSATLSRPFTESPLPPPADKEKAMYFDRPEAYAESRGYEYDPRIGFQLKETEKLKYAQEYGAPEKPIASPFSKENIVRTGRDIQGLPLGAAGLGVAVARDGFLGVLNATNDAWFRTTEDLSAILYDKLGYVPSSNEASYKRVKGVIEDAMSYLDNVEQNIYSKAKTEGARELLKVGSAGGSLLAIIGAARSGNLTPALLTLSATEGFSGYREAEQITGDSQKALENALFKTSTSYLLEKIGANAILGKMFKPKVGEDIAERVIYGMLPEIATEEAQLFTSAGIDNVMLDKSMPTLKEYWDTAWVSAVVSGGAIAMSDIKLPKAKIAEKKALQKLESGGMSKNQAQLVLREFERRAERETEKIVKQLNASLFRESRMANLKGARDSKLREGIEIAAPLPEVSPELKPLYEEAKKYKSAEEFVKAQTIYRGQPENFKFRRAAADVDASDNILIGKGVFTTSDPTMAGTYGKNILEFKKPTEKILDISNASLDDLRKLGVDENTIKVYQDTLKDISPATILGQTVEFDGKTYKVFRKVNVKGEIMYELQPTKYGERIINKSIDEIEKIVKPKQNLSNVKDAEDILMNDIIERFTGGKSVEELLAGGSGEAGKLKTAKEQASKWLNKQGYNFVKHQGGVRAGGGKELHDVYIALSDEALKPQTKSQLADIWNKANQANPADALINEAKKYKSPEEFVKAQGNKIELSRNYGENRVDTDNFRGGTWYVEGKDGSMFYDFSGSEFPDVGGEKFIATEASIKKPLRIMDEELETANIEDGTLFLIKSGNDKYIASEERNIAKKLWDKWEEASSIEEQKQLASDALRKIGLDNAKINAILDSTNVRDITFDNIISKGLEKNGYDALIIETYAGENHVFKLPQAKTKSQLADIWNEANAKLPTTPLKTDDVAYLGADRKIQPQELVDREKLKTPKQLEERIYKEQELESELDSIESALAPYDREDLALFRRFSRNYEKQGGDIESLRKIKPELVEQTIARYREQNPNLKEADVEQEAVDFILNIATREKVQTIKRERRLTKKEIRKLTKRMQGIEKRAESRAKQKAVEKVKSDIIQFAKAIPRSERGGLLVKVKNAKTNEDLNEAVLLIEKIQNKVEIEQTKKEIRKLLETTKPIRGGRTPKGKLSPESQQFLDVLRKYTKNEKGADEYVLNQMEKKDGELDYQQGLLNRALWGFFGDIKELKISKDIIKQIREEGELMNALKKYTNYQEVENIVEDVLEAVGDYKPTRGRVNLPTGTRFRMALENLGSTMFALKDYAEVFDSFKSNRASTYEGAIVRDVNLIEQEQKRAELKEKWTNAVNDLVAKSYGLEGKGLGRQILKKINDDNKVYSLTKEGKLKEVKAITPEEYIEYSDGSRGDLLVTKAELRKLWAEMQDETLQKSLREANGYGDEVFKAVDRAMTQEDKVFVEGLFEIYNDQIYPEVNKVFRKLNNVNLPKNLKYTPIKRVGFQPKEDSMTSGLGEVISRATMDKGALIFRKNIVMEIMPQSDMAALISHIEEMSHYVAFAEKMKILRTAFSDARLQTAVKQNLGDNGIKILSNLKRTLERIVTQARETAESGSILDFVRKNYVIASLALKAKVAITQLTGAFAFVEKIPTKYFALEMGKMLNPKKLKEAHDFFTKYSPIYRERGVSFDRDLAEIANSTVAKRFVGRSSFSNWIMLNVKAGDKGSILLGGYPFYQYRFAEIQKANPNWTEAQVRNRAILDLEKAINETLQSGNISDLTLLQSNKNPFLRFFTTYLSNPTLYFQRAWAYGRAFMQNPSTANMKGFLLYHSILPVIYQAVANLLPWDDDDKANYIRAAILGNFNAIPLIGEGIEAFSRQITNLFLDKEDQLKIFPARGTIISDVFDQTTKALKGVKQYNDGDIELSEMIRRLSELSEPAAGVPASTLFNIYEGIGDVLEENYRDGLLKFGGYSPYSIEERFSKPKSKVIKTETPYDDFFKSFDVSQNEKKYDDFFNSLD